MIIAKKHLDTKYEGDIQIVRTQLIKTVIPDALFEEVCEYIGEQKDYASCVYLCIDESYILDVDEVIEEIETSILEDKEDLEDHEITFWNEVAKAFKLYEGCTLYMENKKDG